MGRPDPDNRWTNPSWARVGWALWAVLALVVSTIIVREIIVVPRADWRSVTPVYRKAAGDWWASRPLYTEGLEGFLYLPQAAIVFTPFTWLHEPVGEALWRLVNIGVLAGGLWRLARLTGGVRWAVIFAVASGLAVLTAMGSARNGQMNVALAGLMALAAAGLADRRWWRGTVLLALAVACKPLAIVMVLLAAAVYPAMSWRLAVGLAVLLAAAFIHPDPSYVGRQYADFWRKLTTAAKPLAGDFQDLAGLMTSLRIDLAERTYTVIRVLAAAATLAACWLARRRFGPTIGAVYLLALGAAYLMLFNPRTEGLTYVVLGSPVALFAAQELSARRRWTGGALVAVCVVLAFSRTLTMGKNVWLRPLVTAGFMAYAVAQVAKNRPAWRGDDRAERAAGPTAA